MTPEGTNVVVAILGAVVGAILGGGGVLIIVSRMIAKVKTDPITLDYIEKLYLSIPVDTVRELLRNAAVIADKVTDGMPNTVFPTFPTQGDATTVTTTTTSTSVGDAPANLVNTAKG